jgi:hypothetical protein
MTRDDEDRRLIDAIDRAFRPEPMSPARRAAFRTALDARIEQRARGKRWLVSGLAASAAAALALWIARPDATTPVPPNESGSELYAFIDPEVPEYTRYLPDDYQALALMIGAEPEEDR